MELTALSRGYDRALWISAADVPFFSLRPNPSETPVFAAFRSKNNRLNCQYLYLLDSFTPQSLSRLYTLANPEVNSRCRDTGKPLPATALSIRNRMAEQALYFITAADSGLDSRAPHARAAQQYRQNSSPSSPLFFLTANLHKTYTANIPQPARKAFDYLRKYRSQQLTSLNILGADDIDDAARKSLKYVADADTREALQTIFYAFSFASQLCRGELSPQTVNLRGRPASRPPSAGRPKDMETPIGEFIRS
jgi:hypothetical protein